MLSQNQEPGLLPHTEHLLVFLCSLEGKAITWVAAQASTRLRKSTPADDLVLEHTSAYCQQAVACTSKQKDEAFDNYILKIKILPLKYNFYAFQM